VSDPRRLKYTLMLLILAGSGLALLGSTQTWFSLTLTKASNHLGAVTIQGSVAAPALTALSLAGLALAVALAIAGNVVRLIMGVLGVVVGASVLLSAGIAVGDPIKTSSAAVTAATGVSGTTSVNRLVATVSISVWPWFAVAGGVILVLASVAVLVTSRRWPGTSRRFDAVRFEDADPNAQRKHALGDDAALDADDSDEIRSSEIIDGGAADTRAGAASAAAPPKVEQLNARDIAIDTWEELSRGEDPTSYGDEDDDSTPEDATDGEDSARGEGPAS
jgi:uncharacterized membrane protein (TIGR02234 family)